MKIYQFFTRNLSLPMCSLVAENEYKAIDLFEKEYGVNFKSTTAFRERLYRVKELRLKGYKVVKKDEPNFTIGWEVE